MKILSKKLSSYSKKKLIVGLGSIFVFFIFGSLYLLPLLDNRKSYFDSEMTFIKDDTKDLSDVDFWEYPELQDYEIAVSPFINWSKFWNVFKNHAVWKLEAFNPQLEDWVDATSLLTVDRNYTSNNTCKIGLEFTTPDNGLSLDWRFTLGIDYKVKQFINRSGAYEYSLNYTVNNKSLNVVFNWSDMLQYSGLIFKHGVKNISGDKFFWFRVRRNGIPPNFYVDLDPVYTVHTLSTVTMPDNFARAVVRLSNQTLYCMYKDYTTGTYLSWSENNGTSWSNKLVNSDLTVGYQNLIADSNDRLHFFMTKRNASNLKYLGYYCNSTDWNDVRMITPFNGQNCYLKSAVVDGNDTIHAFYDDAGVLMYFQSTDYGDTWSTPQQITWEATANPMGCTVTANGNIHILWYARDYDESYDALLHSYSSDNGNTWSNWTHDVIFQGVSADEPRNGNIRTYDNNTVIVAFDTTGGDTYYYENDSSGWIVKDLMFDSQPDYPTFTVSQNNTIYYIYYRQGSYDFKLFTNFSGNGWDAGQHLESEDAWSFMISCNNFYPFIDGQHISQPSKGFAVVGKFGNPCTAVKYYASSDLNWTWTEAGEPSLSWENSDYFYGTVTNNTYWNNSDYFYGSVTNNTFWRNSDYFYGTVKNNTFWANSDYFYGSVTNNTFWRNSDYFYGTVKNNTFWANSDYFYGSVTNNTFWRNSDYFYGSVLNSISWANSDYFYGSVKNNTYWRNSDYFYGSVKNNTYWRNSDYFYGSVTNNTFWANSDYFYGSVLNGANWENSDYFYGSVKNNTFWANSDYFYGSVTNNTFWANSDYFYGSVKNNTYWRNSDYFYGTVTNNTFWANSDYFYGSVLNSISWANSDYFYGSVKNGTVFQWENSDYLYGSVKNNTYWRNSDYFYGSVLNSISWDNSDYFYGSVLNVTSWDNSDYFYGSVKNNTYWRNSDYFYGSVLNSISWDNSDYFYGSVLNVTSWDNSDYFYGSVLNVSALNNCPIVSNPYPNNNSLGVSVSISTIQIDVIDIEGDLLNWSIWLSNGLQSFQNYAGNMTAKLNLSSNLEYNTSYKWYFNVTDGNCNKSYWFSFSTRSEAEEAAVEDTTVIDVINTIAWIFFILVFILKLINVITVATFYPRIHVITTLLIGSLCYFFILIAVITDPSVVKVSILYFFSFLYVLIWIFTILEAIELLGNKNFRGRHNDYLNDREKP